MPPMKNLTLSCVICFAAFNFITLSTALAQPGKSNETTTGDGPTVQALLSEVHLLRLALQHVHSTASRVQILVERICLQQERVDRLARDFEEVRNLIADIKLHQTRNAEIIREMETQIRNEGFPARRAELERQLRFLKMEIEPLNLREQRQREREIQLAGQWQIEQAKLAALNDRLDALEREAEIEASPERPRRRQ
jgi:hypothetical protein